MATTAVAPSPITLPAPLLTYSSYLNEGLVAGHYDILEGVRVFMPAPTWRHQRVSYHVARLLHVLFPI